MICAGKDPIHSFANCCVSLLEPLIWSGREKRVAIGPERVLMCETDGVDHSRRNTSLITIMRERCNKDEWSGGLASRGRHRLHRAASHIAYTSLDFIIYISYDTFITRRSPGWKIWHYCSFHTNSNMSIQNNKWNSYRLSLNNCQNERFNSCTYNCI